MQIKVITMRYCEGIQGFSEDALRTATYGREVLDCEQQFFLHGCVPHIVLTLKLADVGEGGGRPNFIRRAGDENSLLDAMNDDQKRIYRELKKWRNATTKTRGLPTYALGRNTLMAEIVKRAPQTLAALKEIDGCGEKFCKDYGRTVLKIVAGLKPAADAADAQERVPPEETDAGAADAQERVPPEAAPADGNDPEGGYLL